MLIFSDSRALHFTMQMLIDKYNSTERGNTGKKEGGRKKGGKNRAVKQKGR